MRKIIVIFLIIVLAIVLVYLTIYNYTDIFVPHYRASKFHDPYYQQLAESCSKESLGCCLASVEIMQASNFRLYTPGVDCPEGYQRSTLKCIGSYDWCQSVE